jgi:hypothetical protein
MLAAIQKGTSPAFSPATDSKLRFMGNWSDGTPVKELKFRGNP